MKLKSLVLGFGLGISVGWILFGRLSLTPRPPFLQAETEPVHTEDPPAPAPPPEPAPEPEPDFEPDHEPAAVLRLLENGTPADVRWLFRTLGREFTDEEVQVLADRMEVTIVDGERHIFGAVLNTLCDCRNDIARTRLLEFIVDERFPTLDGNGFVEVFEGSELPGIAAAARRRWVMNAAAGWSPQSASDGWADLIEAHGGPCDLAWLRQNSESRPR